MPETTDDGHKCCKCGREEPTDESFLGFHAWGDLEICDDCATVWGCNCCKSLSDEAWAIVRGAEE